jgi:hypothetical protein
MTKEELQQCLTRISDRMQEVWDTYGWTQNQMGSDDVGYCLRGCWYRALDLIDGNGSSNLDTVFHSPEITLVTPWFDSAVAHTLLDLFPDNAAFGIEVFNDRDECTEEDVRLVAKHAVARLATMVEAS